MAPQKAIPEIESIYTYCRETDGANSSVKILDHVSDKNHSAKDERIVDFDEDTENYIVGDRVLVGGNKSGVIAFIGETQFGPGDWAGIVLDEPCGKNDGSVAGVRYFQCPQNKGIFARISRLRRLSVDSSMYTEPSYSSPSTIMDTKYPYSTAAYKAFRSDFEFPYRGFSKENESTPRSDLKIGDRVIVQSSQGSKVGLLRYYGPTEFSSGSWCGVELDDPLGKNDGSVNGVRYFRCAQKFGLFVPAEKVSRSPISKPKAPPCVVHPDGTRISREGTLDSLRSAASAENGNHNRTHSPSGSRAKKSPMQVRVVKVYYPEWESEYY